MTPLSDEAISRNGALCIRKHVPIVIGGLKVIVYRGHVTLQGRAQLDFLKSRAEKVVRELPGVTGLTNDIMVAPPPVVPRRPPGMRMTRRWTGSRTAAAAAAKPVSAEQQQSA